MALLRHYIGARRDARRRRRELAWGMRDVEGEIWHLVQSRPQYRAVRQAHRRGMEEYIRNGGDLEAQHRRTSLAMSKELMLTGDFVSDNTPFSFSGHLYPENARDLMFAWGRAQSWPGIAEPRRKARLANLRASPPESHAYQAARAYDEALLRWLADGDATNMGRHHAAAWAHIERVPPQPPQRPQARPPAAAPPLSLPVEVDFDEVRSI